MPSKCFSQAEVDQRRLLSQSPSTSLCYSFSASNLFSTILSPGSASSATEDLKRRKYSQLVADFEYVPMAVEISVIIVPDGCSLLTEIGRSISRAANDPRQTSCIFQQISVAIIKGIALSMLSSLKRYALK